MFKSRTVILREDGRRKLTVDKRNRVAVDDDVHDVIRSLEDVAPKGAKPGLRNAARNVGIRKIEESVARQHRWGIEPARRLRLRPFPKRIPREPTKEQVT